MLPLLPVIAMALIQLSYMLYLTTLLHEIIDEFNDIVVAALSCNLTNVVNIQYSGNTDIQILIIFLQVVQVTRGLR